MVGDLICDDLVSVFSVSFPCIWICYGVLTPKRLVVDGQRDEHDWHDLSLQPYHLYALWVVKRVLRSNPGPGASQCYDGIRPVQ